MLRGAFEDFTMEWLIGYKISAVLGSGVSSLRSPKRRNFNVCI